jgi:putative ABC transport system permease protein
MQRWLQGFACHIDLWLLAFVLASALALCIALATVIGHAVMVARARPAEALRYQ